MKTEKIETYTIDFDSRTIPVAVYRRKRKTFAIMVQPDLTVNAYVPLRLSSAEIHRFLNKKAPWIVRKLDKQEQYHPLPQPKQYISGETFVYLGRQYRLKVLPGAEGQTKLVGRYLYVPVRYEQKNGDVKNAVNAWYRRRAKDVFLKKLTRSMDVVARHGITTQPELTVRKMKRRWGSCNSEGKIILNLNLIQTPVHCVEYVIMHELCHLKEGKHDRSFYSLLTRCMPDWRQRKETLDGIVI